MGLRKKLITPVLLIFVLFVNGQGTEYVNFIAMNMDIKATMEEHELQDDMLDNQTLNTAVEHTNKGIWEEVKEVKEKIRKRLNIVSTLVQGAPTGYVLYNDYEAIVRIQGRIYNELEDSPELLIDVFQEQITFMDDLQMSMRFILGVVASYGTINQMENKERQVLLDFALDEVKNLKSNALLTLYKIQDIKAKRRMQLAQIQYQINQDRQVVEDILTNIGF